MTTTFPDISSHLNADSTCQKAVRLNGGRNLAQVLLEVYNAIPDDQTELRQEYRNTIDLWLQKDVIFVAPELFPTVIWKQAQNHMVNLFASSAQHDWNRKCADIFSSRNNKKSRGA